MGFNMVFVLINERKTTLLQIARGLKKVDPKYRFESEEYFVYGNDLLGQVEINRPGDGIFEGDIEQYRERLDDKPDAPGVAKVREYLDAATGIFFVNVIWELPDSDETIKRFWPLWDWFFANREGILFVDHEGFYDANGLLLPTGKHPEAACV